MKKDSEHEPDTWAPLSAANTRILRPIFPMALSDAVGAASSEPTEKKHEHGKRQTSRDGTEERRAEDQREYIEQRLKELAAFERKMRGQRG